MRIRQGFISNSSSASFVILHPESLSRNQVNMIANHIYFGSKSGLDFATDHNAWNVKITRCPNCGCAQSISGDTSMANFDMEEFLLKVVRIEPEDFEYNCDG